MRAPASVNDLVSELKKVTGSDFDTVYKPERIREIRRNYSDISKAKEMMGFEPEIEFGEGLKGLWDL